MMKDNNDWVIRNTRDAEGRGMYTSGRLWAKKVNNLHTVPASDVSWARQLQALEEVVESPHL